MNRLVAPLAAALLLAPVALRCCATDALGADTKLAEVCRALGKPRSIRARFEQVKSSKAFTKPQRAEGTIEIARPARLRLEYTAPHAMVLIASADRVTVQYPNLGEKQTFDKDHDPHMKAVFDMILAFADPDPERMLAAFDVTVAPGKTAHLVLTPRSAGAASMIDRIELWADTERGALARMRLVDRRASETEWRFLDVEVDGPIDERRLTP